MGNGDSCQIHTPQKQPNNASAQIGERLEIAAGCGPAGTVSNYLKKYMPDNGEYSWDGEGSLGSCHYPDTDPGKRMSCSAGCVNGKCSTIGAKGHYKRTSYKANKIDCCKGLGAVFGTIGNVTCDPDYRYPTSAKCKDMIKDDCNEGYNIFSKDYCQQYCTEPQHVEWCKNSKQSVCNSQTAIKNNDQCYDWCNENRELCSTGIRDYCTGTKLLKGNESICKNYCSDSKNRGWCKMQKKKHCNDTNVESKECQTFCMDNFGECDSGMANFCELYPSHPFCSCIHSVVNKYNPLCIDADCEKTGYATNSMLTSKGDECMITDCSQYLEVKDVIAGKELNIVPSFSQQCGAKIISTDDTEINTSTKKNVTKIDVQNNEVIDDEHVANQMDNKHPWAITLIVIMIFIAICAIIYMYLNRNDDDEVEEEEEEI